MSHKFLLIQFFSTQYDKVIRQNIQVKSAKICRKIEKIFKQKKTSGKVRGKMKIY